MSFSETRPAGWYHADADPLGTERYWDGLGWTAEQRQAGAPFSSANAAQPGASSLHGQYLVESNLAGIGNRIGARLLDYLVWVVLTFPLQVAVSIALASEAAEALGDGVRLPLIIELANVATGLAALCLVVGYEVFTNTKWGQSLGKKVAGTKIVLLDGSKPGLVDHIKRMSPYIVLAGLGTLLNLSSQFLTVGLWASVGVVVAQIAIVVAALLMIASEDNQQAPWDKIAGTVVVRDHS